MTVMTKANEMHDELCEADYVYMGYTPCDCMNRELAAAVAELASAVEATAHDC